MSEEHALAKIDPDSVRLTLLISNSFWELLFLRKSTTETDSQGRSASNFWVLWVHERVFRLESKGF